VFFRDRSVTLCPLPAERGRYGGPRSGSRSEPGGDVIQLSALRGVDRFASLAMTAGWATAGVGERNEGWYVFGLSRAGLAVGNLGNFYLRLKWTRLKLMGIVCFFAFLCEKVIKTCRFSCVQLCGCEGGRLGRVRVGEKENVFGQWVEWGVFHVEHIRNEIWSCQARRIHFHFLLFSRVWFDSSHVCCASQGGSLCFARDDGGARARE